MVFRDADQKSWLAYGRRRGGLYLWDKRSNHDMAGLLNIAEVTEKIKAYDKRSRLSRLWIRLTTSIEKERELLLYHYGCELIEVLSAAQTDAGMARCRQVLKEFQVIGQGLSRFSVLKKPWMQLSTYIKGFLTWTKKLTTVKRGEAEPLVLQRIDPQPEAVNAPAQVNNREQVEGDNSTALVVAQRGPAKRPGRRRVQRKPSIGASAASSSIDSPEAIERYRMREEEDRAELSRRLVQAENRLFGMKERNGERVDACFSDFKKMIRDLKRRYHADKSIVYAKELGLSPEKYAELVIESFQELNPFLNELRGYYEGLRDFFEKDYQQTLALKELEEGFKRLFEDLEEIARKQAELALELNEDNRKKWQAYIDSREAEHTRLDEVFDRMSEKIDRLEKEHQENVETNARVMREHQENVETNARVMREHQENVETNARVMREHQENVETNARVMREHQENVETNARVMREHQENVEAVERAERESKKTAEAVDRAEKESQALKKQLLELEREGQALEKEVKSLMLRRACERKESQKEPTETGHQSAFFIPPKCNTHQQITVQPNTSEANRIVI